MTEQFGKSLLRTEDGGGIAVIACRLCGGSQIGSMSLSREQFSDVNGRERMADTWAAITEAQHDRAEHPDTEGPQA